MPKAIFIHDGNAIDYTPSADIAAGGVVVQGELVGVAKQPIAANALGALAVAGVFDFPKATGGGSAIGAGVNVYWDATNGVATTDPDGGATTCARSAWRRCPRRRGSRSNTSRSSRQSTSTSIGSSRAF
jgi:predicted RecA/RadA family phage recombinase